MHERHREAFAPIILTLIEKRPYEEFEELIAGFLHTVGNIRSPIRSTP